MQACMRTIYINTGEVSKYKSTKVRTYFDTFVL